MRLLSWYRRMHWGARLALGIPAAAAALAVLYVVSRAFQYASEEGDAGVFTPRRANVVVRARGLTDHWRRIRRTQAWRAVERRVLRDAAVRRALNEALKGSGLPALDDLEDVRRRGPYTMDNLFRAAGRDAVLALRVGDSWKKVSWCAATRLRFTDYLLAPMARLAFSSEKISGYPCLRVSMGGRVVFAAVRGAVVVMGSDREMMADALRARGGGLLPVRPVLLRVNFGDSKALSDLMRLLAEAGLSLWARLETVRALEATADVVGSAVVAEVFLDGAEAARPDPPPAEFRRLAPAYAAGCIFLAAGAGDVFAWLKGLAEGGSSQDFREALKVLEEAGLASGFLPKTGPGVAALLGGEERGGRLYPSVALVFPSRDPRGAVDALDSAIRAMAGERSEGRFERRQVGGFEMTAWEWHRGIHLGPAQLNDVLRPCYAALDGAVVLGNNATFVEAVLERASGRGEEFAAQGAHRRASEMLVALGMRADPPPAGLFVYPPALRESMDGLLRVLAAMAAYSAVDGAKLRAGIVADLKRRGRPAAEDEIRELYNAAVERSKLDREEVMRRNLGILEAAEWAAAQFEQAGGGVRVRAALEFR